MSTFVFVPVQLPSGQLSIELINDVGVATVNYTDPSILSFAELNESVEERGIGGVLRIADMDIEILDRDGTIQSTVFDSAVTNVYAKITLSQDLGVTEDSIIYGRVDLETVESVSYYDDELGTETHYCKFTVFSLVKNLEEVTIQTMLTELLTVSETYGASGSVANMTAISMTNVVDQIQKLLFSGITTETPTFDFTNTYSTTNTPTKSVTALYVEYSFNGSISYRWNDDPATYLETSYFTLKDVKTFLFMMCKHLLAYPILIYDATSGKFHIKLKQRNAGTVISDMGLLLSSIKTKFIGYDAIRVTHLTDSAASTEYDARYINPPLMDDTQFEILKNTSDYKTFWTVKHPSLTVTEQWAIVIVRDDTGKFAPILQIEDGSDNYPNTDGGWTRFLMQKTSSFWGNPQMFEFDGTTPVKARDMYEREYVGTGIGGGNPVEILDRFAVGGVNYTITEITRDFINDTKTVKAVKYS